MNLNEIKKALYKEKPIAKEIDNGRSGIRGSSAITMSRYRAKTSLGDIDFCVPHHEMGEKNFEKEIPAQLLIRWIVN